MTKERSSRFHIASGLDHFRNSSREDGQELPAMVINRIAWSQAASRRTRRRYAFTEIVDVIQTDNGAGFPSAFHWHVLDKRIQHVYIKPRTPRLNEKVKRSHRIDTEEFYRLLYGIVIDDSTLFSDKLQEWEDYYNYHRPHGGLDGQTPHERLRQKTTAKAAQA